MVGRANLGFALALGIFSSSVFGQAQSCPMADSDACLQAKAGWSASDTCASSAAHCAITTSYPAQPNQEAMDMMSCCGSTCHNGGYTSCAMDNGSCSCSTTPSSSPSGPSPSGPAPSPSPSPSSPTAQPTAATFWAPDATGTGSDNTAVSVCGCDSAHFCDHTFSISSATLDNHCMDCPADPATGCDLITTLPEQGKAECKSWCAGTKKGEGCEWVATNDPVDDTNSKLLGKVETFEACVKLMKADPDCVGKKWAVLDPKTGFGEAAECRCPLADGWDANLSSSTYATAQSCLVEEHENCCAAYKVSGTNPALEKYWGTYVSGQDVEGSAGDSILWREVYGDWNHDGTALKMLYFTGLRWAFMHATTQEVNFQAAQDQRWECPTQATGWEAEINNVYVPVDLTFECTSIPKPKTDKAMETAITIIVVVIVVVVLCFCCALAMCFWTCGARNSGNNNQKSAPATNAKAAVEV